MLLRRFIDWVTDERKRVFRMSDNWKYDSGILHELHRIADLSIQKYDPSNMENFSSYTSRNEIYFWSRMSAIETRKQFPMKTLYRRDGNSSFSVWGADLSEYKMMYESLYATFIKDKLIPISKFVEENIDNPQYQYFFIKYETTIMTVANTLSDAMELNDSISEDIKEEVMSILGSFGQVLADKQREIQQMEEIDKKAVNDSLLERLKREQEYISKYI